MKILLLLLFCFSVAFSQDELAPEAAFESESESVAEFVTEPEFVAEPVVEAEPVPENLSYKEAAKVSDEPLLGWRGWTRIAAFSMAVVSGVVAAMKHSDANKNLDAIDALKVEARESGIYNLNNNDEARYNWRARYIEQSNALADNERDRNILAGAAGVFVTVGVVTFFF